MWLISILLISCCYWLIYIINDIDGTIVSINISSDPIDWGIEATLPVVVVGSVMVVVGSVVVFGSTGPRLSQQTPFSQSCMKLQQPPWIPQPHSKQQQPCGLIVVPEKKSC